VNWRDICEVILFWSEVKWVTSNFLGTKLPCTLGWPYTEGTWLCCDYIIWGVSCTVCFNLFCNLWVCVCVGFVMCGCVYVWVCNVWVCVCVGGCFDNCVGILVICVLVFTVFLYCFFYVYLFLFVTSVRSTATEWKLNCSK